MHGIPQIITKDSQLFQIHQHAEACLKEGMIWESTSDDNASVRNLKECLTSILDDFQKAFDNARCFSKWFICFRYVIRSTTKFLQYALDSNLAQVVIRVQDCLNQNTKDMADMLLSAQVAMNDSPLHRLVKRAWSKHMEDTMLVLVESGSIILHVYVADIESMNQLQTRFRKGCLGEAILELMLILWRSSYPDQSLSDVMLELELTPPFPLRSMFPVERREAAMNTRDKDGRDIWSRAVAAGAIDAIWYLMQQQPGRTTEEFFSRPLIASCEANHQTVVTMLLETYPELVKSHGWQALTQAQTAGNVQMMQLHKTKVEGEEKPERSAKKVILSDSQMTPVTDSPQVEPSVESVMPNKEESTSTHKTTSQPTVVSHKVTGTKRHRYLLDRVFMNHIKYTQQQVELDKGHGKETPLPSAGEASFELLFIYDAVIVHSGNALDEELALKLAHGMEDHILIDGKKKPRVYVHPITEPFGRSRIMEYSTSTFVKVSKYLTEDLWARMMKCEALVDAIEKQELNWSLIPVYTQLPGKRDYEIPFGLKNLNGIIFTGEQSEYFYIKIGKFLSSKLFVRREREAKLTLGKVRGKEKVYKPYEDFLPKLEYRFMLDPMQGLSIHNPYKYMQGKREGTVAPPTSTYHLDINTAQDLNLGDYVHTEAESRKTEPRRSVRMVDDSVQEEEYAAGVTSKAGKSISKGTTGTEHIKSRHIRQSVNRGITQPDGPNPGYCYNMTQEPRGYCVIINNATFQSLPDIEGSDIDKEKLCKTWMNLKFKVITWDNLTGEQIDRALTHFSQKDHSKFDAFVCCIISHGDKGVIHGTDNKTVNICELVSKFTNSSCTTLAGKPKLFFFQACRGDDTPRVLKIGYDEACSDGIYRQLTRGIPDPADFLLGYAEIYGNAAYPLPDKGSLYICALTKMLDQLSDKQPLQVIMSCVNGEIFERGGPSMERIYKVPDPVCHLTKPLYFFEETAKKMNCVMKK